MTMGKKTPQRRSTAPLPVPVTPRGLRELREEAAKFDVDLKTFARATIDRGIHDRPMHTDVVLVRRVGSEIDALRPRWLAINQPATDEQIASEMLRLTTTMPHASNINPNLLNETACEDIEELKPTLFALVRGCHAVRAKHTFLNISDLVKEIQAAQRNAGRYSCALEEFRLDDFEADLEEEIERHEARALEWKAERKRRKIAEHRQRKADREMEKWQEKWRRQLLDGEDANDENDEENSDDGAST
jgi:hypothetical protein